MTIKFYHETDPTDLIRTISYMYKILTDPNDVIDLDLSQVGANHGK